MLVDIKLLCIKKVVGYREAHRHLAQHRHVEVSIAESEEAGCVDQVYSVQQGLVQESM